MSTTYQESRRIQHHSTYSPRHNAGNAVGRMGHQRTTTITTSATAITTAETATTTTANEKPHPCHGARQERYPHKPLDPATLSPCQEPAQSKVTSPSRSSQSPLKTSNSHRSSSRVTMPHLDSFAPPSPPLNSPHRSHPSSSSVSHYHRSLAYDPSLPLSPESPRRHQHHQQHRARSSPGMSNESSTDAIVTTTIPRMPSRRTLYRHSTLVWIKQVETGTTTTHGEKCHSWKDLLELYAGVESLEAVVEPVTSTRQQQPQQQQRRDASHGQRRDPDESPSPLDTSYGTAQTADQSCSSHNSSSNSCSPGCFKRTRVRQPSNPWGDKSWDNRGHSHRLTAMPSTLPSTSAGKDLSTVQGSTSPFPIPSAVRGDPPSTSTARNPTSSGRVTPQGPEGLHATSDCDTTRKTMRGSPHSLSCADSTKNHPDDHDESNKTTTPKEPLEHTGNLVNKGKGGKQGRLPLWRRMMMLGRVTKKNNKTTNGPWYLAAMVHGSPDEESGSLMTTSHETTGSSNNNPEPSLTFDESQRGGTMHMTFFT